MRKTATITITAAGRDQGKVFSLRELPASQGERWALRVFLALTKSGIEIPDSVQAMGMAGIAVIGLKALGGVSWEVAEPLLAEMFACVKFVPDPSRPEVERALIEDDIEEIATRLRLRKEVFGLHVDFSKAGALLNSESAPAEVAGQ